MYSPKIPKPNVLTVSQLTFYIKSVLENDPRLGVVLLTGEISNLTDHYRSGHIYLSLKDERSVIRAVMFAGNARRLRFQPQNGMKVICRGRVSLYEASGQYQLYIEDMQPDGIGALTLAFEQLKERLEGQGLFAASHKKQLPRFPKTVGVITSPTGAAVQDIRNILYRRYPLINMILCPVTVQGESAPPQLIRAIKQLDASQKCDVIIIGRGGGSLEDLWAFNSEELAHAIYDCHTPVISAVGHETDFTICDFMADMRAPTPSAAAELAVPDRVELLAYYRSQIQYLTSLMEGRLRQEKNREIHYHGRMIRSKSMMKLQRLDNRCHYLCMSLQKSAQTTILQREALYKTYAAKLEGLSPLAPLLRGYTITEKNGAVISSKAALQVGDEITVRFSDGTIQATVTGE